MTLILLILQIILAVCLVLIILLQRNSSEGWSGVASSGSGTGVISKRSSNNILIKITAIIATLFMLNSIVLGNLVTKNRKKSSLIEKSLTSEEVKNLSDSAQKESSVPLAE